MTPEIERLAKEAGMVLINQRIMRRDGDYIRYETTPEPLPQWVAKFAALVAESCAKECDGVYYQNIGPAHGEVRYGIAACSAAIRAKFALSHKTPEAK